MRRIVLFASLGLMLGCSVTVNQPKLNTDVNAKLNVKADTAVSTSIAPEPSATASASSTPDPTVARVMYDACGSQHIYSGTFEPPSPFPSSGMEACYASFGPVPPEVKATPAPTPGPSDLPTPTPLPQPSHVSRQPDGSIIAAGGGT